MGGTCRSASRGVWEAVGFPGLELRAQEEWVWEPVYEEVREESRWKGRGTVAFKV